jgi:hypothetical protein
VMRSPGRAWAPVRGPVPTFSPASSTPIFGELDHEYLEVPDGHPEARLRILVGVEGADATRLARMAAERGKKPGEVVAELLRNAAGQATDARAGARAEVRNGYSRRTTAVSRRHGQDRITCRFAGTFCVNRDRARPAVPAPGDDGKEGVGGSSPPEGFRETAASRRFPHFRTRSGRWVAEHLRNTVGSPRRPDAPADLAFVALASSVSVKSSAGALDLLSSAGTRCAGSKSSFTRA